MDVKIMSNMKDIWDHARSKGHLWMLNASDMGGRQRRGEIMMSIIDENNKEISLLLPSTWLPLDLLTFSTQENFERSTSFRKYLTSGILAAIDDDVAQMLLKHATAPAEQERVSKLMANNPNALGSSVFRDNATITLNLSARAEPIAESKTPITKGDGINTPETLAVLEKLTKQSNAEFIANPDELIGFLARAGLSEVQAVAAGMSDFNHPAFVYLDQAMGTLGQGRTVTVEELQALRGKEDPGTGPAITLTQ